MLNNIDLDEYGFIKNRSQWSESVAQQMAQLDGIELSPQHWEIIRFMQQYYDLYNHQPNARLFGQAVKKMLGEDKGASAYLYGLFPDGPLKYANKYAGLPIPPSCI